LTSVVAEKVEIKNLLAELSFIAEKPPSKFRLPGPAVRHGVHPTLPPLATRSKILRRSAYERPVFGEELELCRGSSRPLPGIRRATPSYGFRLAAAGQVRRFNDCCC
jgi:hypothetical protein